MGPLIFIGGRTHRCPTPIDYQTLSRYVFGIIGDQEQNSLGYIVDRCRSAQGRNIFPGPEIVFILQGSFGKGGTRSYCIDIYFIGR